MDTLPQALAHAIATGNWQILGGAAFALALAYGGLGFAQKAGEQLVALGRWAFSWFRAHAPAVAWLPMDQIEERFLTLLTRAVSNQVNLKQAIASVVVDGTVTADELNTLLQAIWEDLKSNVGVSDWASFAMALLGNASAPAASTEKRLRALFDANVHGILAEKAQGVFERRLAVRELRARGLPSRSS